jgi:ribosomal protein S12 methylthiotransferase
MWCYLEVKNDDFLFSLQNLFAIIPYHQSEALAVLSSKILWFKDDILKQYFEKKKQNNLLSKAFIWKSSDVRAYLHADYKYEYLKISEGCDNNCTFCIIPSIRWRQQSRTKEDILQEVKTMVHYGIQEIEIIAQDVSRYGIDLYWKSHLIELLEEIDSLPWDFTYRLFYLYPDILTWEYLQKLKHLKKMIPYFDIPFQHISPNILKLMGRFYDQNHIYSFLNSLQENFPNAFLHTNFIVWFPWETQEDFEKLKSFVKHYEFDSVSLFWYHDEILASSSKLPDKVKDSIIHTRVLELQEILEEIYEKKYQQRVGKIQSGYIHEISWKKISVRPEIKAPEIDEYDIIKKDSLLSWNIGIWEKITYILPK